MGINRKFHSVQFIWFILWETKSIPNEWNCETTECWCSLFWIVWIPFFFFARNFKQTFYHFVNNDTPLVWYARTCTFSSLLLWKLENLHESARNHKEKKVPWKSWLPLESISNIQFAHKRYNIPFHFDCLYGVLVIRTRNSHNQKHDSRLALASFWPLFSHLAGTWIVSRFKKSVLFWLNFFFYFYHIKSLANKLINLKRSSWIARHFRLCFMLCVSLSCLMS